MITTYLMIALGVLFLMLLAALVGIRVIKLKHAHDCEISFYKDKKEEIEERFARFLLDSENIVTSDDFTHYVKMKKLSDLINQCKISF